MKISYNYNGLGEILIDKKINKNDLAERVGIMPPTASKMGRVEFALMDVLYRIGKTLDVDFDFEDIVSSSVRSKGEENE